MNGDNAQTIASYNKTVAMYIDASPQIVTGDLKAWIDKSLNGLSSDAKIIEIGSGSGKDADYFAAKGFEVELTDASQGFVDHLIKSGKKARLLNVLVDELGAAYDMVFADAVFLHFNRSQLELVLRKVQASLQPHGRLAFSLKAGDGEEITERKLDMPRYFCYWKPGAIKKLLAKAGFGHIEIQVTGDNRGGARPDWLHINAVKT